ncbi:MAG: Lrp/AsnC family transcriptional regulator [bacterium]|nr:Lrp/AsnC family transcriptional regulator [bacterium]
MELSTRDKQLIVLLSGDLPETLTPYRDVALRLQGLPEEELLATIKRFKESGILRRFGAVLRHHQAGFAANAMVVYQVREEEIARTAEAIVSSPAVSHCYQRETRPGWPYNLYAMVHGRTKQQCQEVAAGIARSIGNPNYRLLFSVREYKKTSPSFFQ